METLRAPSQYSKTTWHLSSGAPGLLSKRAAQPRCCLFLVQAFRGFPGSSLSEYTRLLQEEAKGQLAS